MSEVAKAAEESPNITLVDLQNALHIIDTAAERGAFKGNELSSVGLVRDRLSFFLESTTASESEEKVSSEEK